jgi:hypothetical protein
VSVHDLGFTFKGTLMMPFDFDQSEKERRWLRNWLKRTRKRFASGKVRGSRTDIPRDAIVAAGRSVQFSASDGTKAA